MSLCLLSAQAHSGLCLPAVLCVGLGLGLGRGCLLRSGHVSIRCTTLVTGITWSGQADSHGVMSEAHLSRLERSSRRVYCVAGFRVGWLATGLWSLPLSVSAAAVRYWRRGEVAVEDLGGTVETGRGDAIHIIVEGGG